MFIRLVKLNLSNDYANDMTSNLLEHIKKTHKCNVIGFYVLKRIRRWDLEKYIDYKDWDKINKLNSK